MATDHCNCGGQKDQGSCAACQADEIFPYWCNSCNRSVSDKRCPYCGLKAQRKRASEPGPKAK